MRRESFLGQVLTAITRTTPASSPVRHVAEDTRTQRPASQLLMALARSTPAFMPGSYRTLGDSLKASPQPGAYRSVGHADSGDGSGEDLLDFRRWIPQTRHRSSYRQALIVVLAAVAIPVVIASVVIIKASLNTKTGYEPAGGVPYSASPKPKPKPTTSALKTALILANNSADAKGLIPPSTCKQVNAATVTCTAPSPGITAAIFQTYPGQQALYNAYTAKVAALTSRHQFRQNFSDCESQLTYGEVGWNHQLKHTTKYTVSQMIKGTVTDDQAAGRVFCINAQGLEYMVWTQNDGHLMGYIAGPVHTDVWNWWVAIHHNIGIGSSGQVTIAASAARNPNAASVALFLDTYFSAINAHDYTTYISLLSPQLRSEITAEQFQKGYKSIADSAETLVGISSTPGAGLAAAVTFTSHQNPADSPDQQQSCTNWSITLYLIQSRSGYLIDPAPSGYHATYSAC